MHCFSRRSTVHDPFVLRFHRSGCRFALGLSSWVYDEAPSSIRGADTTHLNQQGGWGSTGSKHPPKLADGAASREGRAPGGGAWVWQGGLVQHYLTAISAGLSLVLAIIGAILIHGSGERKSR